MGRERLGTVSQAIWAGQFVDQKTQEEFGLVGWFGCSACLLRNDWLITAAHCVETSDPPVPDPNRPGQNMVVDPATISVKAAWGGSPPIDFDGTPLNGPPSGQFKQAVQIETFRPYDVAIVRVNEPFIVDGSTTARNQLIFNESQFPYFGQRVAVMIRYFGKGQRSVDDLGLEYQGALAQTYKEDDFFYYFPIHEGHFVAPGDSGGPTFAWVMGGWALMGVHSFYQTISLDSADAPVEPVWNQIKAHIGPANSSDFSVDSPPPGFVGVFEHTPPGYKPVWLYSIHPDGVLWWWRKDTATAGWIGPKPVGSGWADFADVIPGGGSTFFALTKNGVLKSYEHDGFNDGRFDWTGPEVIGTKWRFRKIFGGGDGIVYAIREDGTLVWHQFDGVNSATGIPKWNGPIEIASGFADFNEVFSNGQGKIYAMTPDGDLWFYEHLGFATGEANWKTWQRPSGVSSLNRRQVGTDWHKFLHIVPIGDDRILAVTEDGRLLSYKHLGFEVASASDSTGIDQFRENWEGPIELSKHMGWQISKRLFAVLPSSDSGPR